ncbi:MAG TPA: carboxyltransferase domain-containing protein [Acidimicrobiales bacterium]|nr:carboxyltransferase domain-containing protein [Acidimicrobiales bacterium]
MRQLGDEAVLFDVEGGHRAAQALARRIRASDVVPAETTVGVVGPFELVEEGADEAPARLHEIPVVFDGEDLGELGLGGAEVAATLAGRPLEVAFLGFMPGFAYLVGLPEPLARLPRRASPRTRVPAGSLAVGGGYAGIYPVSSPGGWNLLGRTSFRPFDSSSPPYARLRPGDRVLLVAEASLPRPPEPVRTPLEGRDLEVVDPGPLLLVEDLGRRGAGALGIPRSGAANGCWLQVANLAVGNDAGAAALETTGPIRLRAGRDLSLALAGEAVLVVDGSECPQGVVTVVGAGQEVAVGPVRSSARAVLAVGGGIETPLVFESRSCDAVSGLPPGPLRAGDALDVGPPAGRPRRRFGLPAPRRAPGEPVVLRAIAGPDLLARGGLEGRFLVDPRSDRTGVRLAAAAGSQRLEPPEAISSHAVLPGAVQLPPSGDPVILGPDCGPVGGYPVGATVITADLWKVGTLAAGDAVELVAVSLDDAASARAELGETVAASLEGWYPTHVA